MNISTNIFLNSELSNTTHQTLNYSPHDTACKSCCTRHLSLCNVLTPPELKLFSEILTDYKRKAKEIICTEDDEADFIYNIRKGTVRLYKMLPDGRRQVTGFLMAGDFFDIYK